MVPKNDLSFYRLVGVILLAEVWLVVVWSVVTARVFLMVAANALGCDNVTGWGHNRIHVPKLHSTPFSVQSPIKIIRKHHFQ
jgi:hypothetical protein